MRGKRSLGVPIAGAIGFCLSLRPLNDFIYERAGRFSINSTDLYLTMLPRFGIPCALLAMLIIGLLLFAIPALPKQKSHPEASLKGFGEIIRWLRWGLIPIVVPLVAFETVTFIFSDPISFYRPTQFRMNVGGILYVVPVLSVMAGVILCPREHRYLLGRGILYTLIMLGGMLSFVGTLLVNDVFESAFYWLALWLGIASAFWYVSLIPKPNRPSNSF